jgi:hypothetical protein
MTLREPALSRISSRLKAGCSKVSDDAEQFEEWPIPEPMRYFKTAE